MIKKYNEYIGQPINESRIKSMDLPSQIENILSDNDIKNLDEIKYDGKDLLSQSIVKRLQDKDIILIENKSSKDFIILIPKTQRIDIHSYIDGKLENDSGKINVVYSDLILLVNRMYSKEITNIPEHNNTLNNFNPKYNKLTFYAKKITTKDSSFNYVQVKIDNNVCDRVKKLVLGMGFDERSNLREKISFLSDPLKWKLSTSDPKVLLTVQNKVSSIILLDYLAEIKENFNPTTSGFLFESFFAGLIDGHVVDDNSKIDVYLPGKGPYSSKNYQLKLFNESTIYDLNRKKKDGVTVLQSIIDGMPIGQKNFLFIGLKSDNKIETYLVPFNEEFEELMENEGYDQAKLTPGLLKRFKSTKAYSRNMGEDIFQNRTIEYLGTLKFGDFTNKINEIKKDLGDSLKDVWQSIKQLHDDVEGLVTGVSSKKRKLKDPKKQTMENNRAIKQSKKVDTKIRKLFKTITKID